jgi:hemolysin activation/secretion protein
MQSSCLHRFSSTNGTSIRFTSGVPTPLKPTKEFVLFSVRPVSIVSTLAAFAQLFLGGTHICCLGAVAPAEPPSASVAQTTVRTLNVREYRVAGAKHLTAQEIGEAVYPHLGPGRTPEDVEAARTALEAVYKEKGFQTVTVEIPEQDARSGIIVLRATENKVGRLRVKGSRYFSLEQIKKAAPSLAEGSLPNFNDITREIVALNTWTDRRVTPTLRPGVEPGTVDIDLEVKDTLPLHGSIELNNRYSADTTPLRLNGGLSYTNLWQAGHTFGFNFQIAPENTDDAKVYSAFYQMRFPQLPALSLILQGTKQDSNVSTLGGAAVAGRGEILGARAVITLPPRPDFYHSLTFGYDYKKFEENVLFGLVTTQTPITYDPFSIAYSATWAPKGRVTEINAALNFHFRGMGADQAEFDAKRFGSDGSFFYLRGDLAHTQDLPGGFELYALVQGQASGQPLVNSEQFSGGGLGTVRGYLESAALGDNGLFGTLELRTPSLLGWWKNSQSEWRFHAFLDAGYLTLNDPLPEQISRFELASYGLGTSFRLLDTLNGSIDAGVPLIGQGTISPYELLFTFRISAEF